MYRFIISSSAPVNRLHRLHRAANRRRGRALIPVALVVQLGLKGRISNVEHARKVVLPWGGRVVFSPAGWQWQPPLPASKAAPSATREADGRVRVVDVRGRLPNDPRVTPTGGYDTPRWGWVATGWLYVADLFEVETGRRDVRKWVAPDGTLYVYDMGVTFGDPFTFDVYLPPVSGEEVGDE
jgi:hypothetical protein